MIRAYNEGLHQKNFLDHQIVTLFVLVFLVYTDIDPDRIYVFLCLPATVCYVWLLGVQSVLYTRLRIMLSFVK